MFCCFRPAQGPSPSQQKRSGHSTEQCEQHQGPQPLYAAASPAKLVEDVQQSAASTPGNDAQQQQGHPPQTVNHPQPAPVSSTDDKGTDEATQHSDVLSLTPAVPLLVDKSHNADPAHLLCSSSELVTDVCHMRFIGQGGFAAVYQATWQATPVAVKFICAPTFDESSAGFRETVFAKGLSHPNVVQSFACRTCQLDQEFITGTCNEERAVLPPSDSDFQSGEGFGDPRSGRRASNKCVMMKDVLFAVGAAPLCYLTVLIMDFCDKGSLANAIRKGVFKVSTHWPARVSYRALLRTAREIAQGMTHLHAKDVVHADLKPANVLLKSSRADRRGFMVQVSDFGLSRYSRAMTTPESQWATLGYMSPEMLGGRFGKPTDVYSFGITLWEMFTGDKPFADLTQGQIIEGIKAGTLQPRWPEGAPHALMDLTSRCIARDPEARPTFVRIVEELTTMEGNVRQELDVRGLHAAMGGAPQPQQGASGPGGAGGSSGEGSKVAPAAGTKQPPQLTSSAAEAAAAGASSNCTAVAPAAAAAQTAPPAAAAAAAAAAAGANGVSAAGGSTPANGIGANSTSMSTLSALHPSYGSALQGSILGLKAEHSEDDDDDDFRTAKAADSAQLRSLGLAPGWAAVGATAPPPASYAAVLSAGLGPSAPGLPLGPTGAGIPLDSVKEVPSGGSSALLPACVSGSTTGGGGGAVAAGTGASGHQHHVTNSGSVAGVLLGGGMEEPRASGSFPVSMPKCVRSKSFDALHAPGSPAALPTAPPQGAIDSAAVAATTGSGAQLQPAPQPAPAGQFAALRSGRGGAAAGSSAAAGGMGSGSAAGGITQFLHQHGLTVVRESEMGGLGGSVAGSSDRDVAPVPGQQHQGTGSSTAGGSSHGTAAAAMAGSSNVKQQAPAGLLRILHQHGLSVAPAGSKAAGVTKAPSGSAAVPGGIGPSTVPIGPGVPGMGGLPGTPGGAGAPTPGQPL